MCSSEVCVLLDVSNINFANRCFFNRICGGCGQDTGAGEDTRDAADRPQAGGGSHGPGHQQPQASRLAGESVL